MQTRLRIVKKIGCSKSWFPRKRSYLGEYESYRPETSVKIFLWSIPKTFQLTPKRFCGSKKCFRRAKNFILYFTVYFYHKLNESKGSHRKWHNSVTMRSSDLGQVSKFSLVRYLKHFKKAKVVLKRNLFLYTLYLIKILFFI